jgi:hypothetical protein
VNVVSGDHARGGTEIFDAGVGAGADEDAVDGDFSNRHTRLERHVFESALDRAMFGF